VLEELMRSRFSRYEIFCSVCGDTANCTAECQELVT
jgi:hypothetical protein